MENKKHIIIFSHGFGVRKDDLGLLTNIADSLDNCQSFLFDYFNVDENHKTITITPFSEQVQRLTAVYNQVRHEFPEAIIDIICHSQGTLIPALAKLLGVRKTILLTPVFDMSIERTMKRYSGRLDCSIDLNGVSKLYRLGGYERLIPKEYWVERKAIEGPINLYNKYSEKTELIIINAKQDTILGTMELVNLSSTIKVFNIDGDHNFSGKDREGLLKLVHETIHTS